MRKRQQCHFDCIVAIKSAGSHACTSLGITNKIRSGILPVNDTHTQMTNSVAVIHIFPQLKMPRLKWHMVSIK